MSTLNEALEELERDTQYSWIGRKPLAIYTENPSAFQRALHESVIRVTNAPADRLLRALRVADAALTAIEPDGVPGGAMLNELIKRIEIAKRARATLLAIILGEGEK